jgi:hypothetical protein
MADNSTQGGSDTIRTEDRGSYKIGVSLLDVGGTSSEAIIGDSGVAMPVRGLDAHDAAVSGNLKGDGDGRLGEPQGDGGDDIKELAVAELCRQLVGVLRRLPNANSGSSPRAAGIPRYWERARLAMRAAQQELGPHVTAEAALQWAHEQGRFGRLPRDVATFKRYLRGYDAGP